LSGCHSFNVTGPAVVSLEDELDAWLDGAALLLAPPFELSLEQAVAIAPVVNAIESRSANLETFFICYSPFGLSLMFTAYPHSRFLLEDC